MIQRLTMFLFITLLLVSCGETSSPVETTQISSTPTGEQQTLLALGDSLTAGFGVPEADNYPTKLSEILTTEGYNYKVINGGVSGNTSKNLLDRAELYLETEPDIIVLVIGGNDGLRGLSTTDMKQHILGTIDTFSSIDAEIVLGSMDIPINLGLDYRADFRQVYDDIADERDDIHYLGYFLEGVGGDPRFNISDRIHPNADGYDIIVENLYDFLEDENIITK